LWAVVVVPAVQVGPRASRPSRAVRDGAVKGRWWEHGARRVPRLCAPLPLVATPDKPRFIGSRALWPSGTPRQRWRAAAG